MCILWTQVVKEQGNINYVLIMWSYNNHIIMALRADTNRVYVVMPTCQSVNQPLTSDMVPWCQSEKPYKVKSVHNCGIALPANFQVRCSECDNGRTHLHISSDRAIYQSVTYRYTEWLILQCGWPNGTHTVIFQTLPGKTCQTEKSKRNASNCAVPWPTWWANEGQENNYRNHSALHTPYQQNSGTQ